MAIRCPYCQKAIGLKEPKPGRFTTKCPHCSKKFQLLVPEEPGAEPEVKPIRSEREPAAATIAPTTGAETMPVGPQVATRVEATVAGPSTHESMATGAWDQATGPPPTKPALGLGAADETTAQGFELRDDPRPSSDMPATLGGYQVVKELGRGGMGAVYLARQLSLDRNVALKVMRPEWASNPAFVSRFTREAYAAAQLVHHNVVQIYDFGEDHGTNFFSMEFVQGKNLTDVLREKKRLDPEVAAGYVLQAARGLKFAHDQSMIHRDIKPDNLMINEQGIVKVADLGLVKTPAVAEAEIANEQGTAAVASPSRASLLAASSGQITQLNVAMGTPAFMAPEQARDATSVDVRADIYSLGCTLYDLVTGRPPFEGKTALELISKHQNEPALPPERLAARVPKGLSDIIMKMIAKKPEERHANLGEVIQGLEEFLGLSTAGVFSPREEHANLLVESLNGFNSSPTAKLRPKLLLGGAGACALIVLICVLAHQFLIAGGFLGLGLMTALAYFVARGLAEKTHLFLKTRELVLGGGVGDWVMGLAGVVLLLTLLVVFKLFWAWVAFGIVALIVAIGFQRMIDSKAEAERHEAIETLEQMFRGMRLQGLDEETLRQFVCKYSGENWEELYEALFGFEAKLDARNRWGQGERGRPRKKYAAWRDPIVSWIEAKQQARRAAKDQKLLQKIEEKGLEAQGVNLVTARRKARRAAEAMVATAAELKAEARKHPAERRTGNQSVGDSLRRAASKPEEVLVDKESGLYDSSQGGWLSLFLGAKFRFLLGTALLGGCLLWMDQNGIISREKIEELGVKTKDATLQAAQTQDLARLGALRQEAARELDQTLKQAKTKKKTEPLTIRLVPSFLTRPFNGFNSAAAGLILLVSSFFRGCKMTLFALPGAALALFGPALGIPRVGPLDPQSVSMAAGAVLGVVGILFGRGR